MLLNATLRYSTLLYSTLRYAEFEAFFTAVGLHAALHPFSGRRPAVYCMISIVYGSLVAGLPNNRDAIVSCHGRHLRPIFANWLYQLPTLPLPFSPGKLK
jgi:hypothetical protein